MDSDYYLYRGKGRSDGLPADTGILYPTDTSRYSRGKDVYDEERNKYHSSPSHSGRSSSHRNKMADHKTRNEMEDSKSVNSFDSTGKRKSFRRLLTRFAEKTSMTGVPYINNAKFWWAKLIWSAMLLVAIGVMSGHLWYLCDQYLSWPIQTKISLGFETLKFPEVTLCNTNVMHKGRLDKYNGARELKALIQALQPEKLAPNQFDSNYDPLANTPPPDSPVPQTRRKRFVDQYDSFNKSTYGANDKPNARQIKPQNDNDYGGNVDKTTEITDLFTELYMDINKPTRAHLGHNITDMLLSCTFNGRKCPASLIVKEAFRAFMNHFRTVIPDFPELGYTICMFQLHQTAEFGNCWSITSSQFNVRNSGPSTGLTLILFLETGEYLKGVSTGYGIRAQVHEQKSYPFPAEEGLYIPAAMETDIGLRLISIERRGGRYGDCNSGDTFDREYNLKYTRRACQSFCEIEKVIEKCSCYGEIFEEFANLINDTLRPCRSTAEVTCMVNIEQQFELQKLDCTCDNPCNEVQYVKSVSQRQWPGDEYAMVLLEGICEEDKQVCASLRKNPDTISNNFLKLNIYYEDLNYENITEEPEIEIQQFLSDVGGAIGLWIGLSILSLCELVQLFVELCDYGIHKTVKERRIERKKRRKERRKLAAASNKGFQNKYENQWPKTNFDSEQMSDGGIYHLPNGSDVTKSNRYK